VHSGSTLRSLAAVGSVTRDIDLRDNLEIETTTVNRQPR
jgi:hypothetical protein